MAKWKSPREIALIYDEEGAIQSVSVKRVIETADGFDVRRGMKNNPAEELPPALIALAEQVLPQVVGMLEEDPVE